MWIISKPVKPDNEMTEVIYTYGEERWLDGFIWGSIATSLIAAVIIFRK